MKVIKMKKTSLLVVLILVGILVVSAQEAGTFALRLTPGARIPIADSGDLYTIGGGMGLAGEYVIQGYPCSM